MFDISNKLLPAVRKSNQVAVISLDHAPTQAELLILGRRIVEHNPSLQLEYRFAENSPSTIHPLNLDSALARLEAAVGCFPFDGLEDQPYDLARESPLRFALSSTLNLRPKLKVVLPHILSDLTSICELADFSARHLTTGTFPEANSQAVPFDPLMRSKWEQSTEGQFRSNRSTEHWHSILRELTPAKATTRRAVENPTFTRYEIVKPELCKLASSICVKAGASITSTWLLLAAIAQSTMEVLDVHHLPMTLTASNRGALPHSQIANLTQNGLALFRRDERGFSQDTIWKAWTQGMRGYSSAQYANSAIQPLLVAAEEHEIYPLEYCFNDTRGIFVNPKWCEESESRFAERSRFQAVEALHNEICTLSFRLVGTKKRYGLNIVAEDHIFPFPRLRLLVETVQRNLCLLHAQVN